MTGSAFSINGRTFSFEVPLTDAMPIGAYVQITAADGRLFLGQVLEETVGTQSGTSGESRTASREIRGSGNLLAELADGGSRRLDGSAVFGTGDLELAAPGLVADHLTSARGDSVGIEVGGIQGMKGVAAQLDAGGFGRHTFLCGQSGSGKTYTLGIILERLLLNTDIKISIIDPNSDYVNLGSLRPRRQTGLSVADHRELAARYEAMAAGIHVFGGPDSPEPMRVWFGELTFEQQTMVLGLDPFASPEEFNAFVRIIKKIPGTQYGLEDVLAEIRSSFDDRLRRLGLRIENLGVADLSIWAGDGRHATRESLPDDARMSVLDVGTLPTRQETSIAAAAFLGRQWELRNRREPSLIVIDEAHNVCPQHPGDRNQALATEHVVRIAGEGRKYGLYLLLATQRPEKVHENVVSQCDNLILMKMNSATDIRDLSETFSYAPSALVEKAAGFGLGEGLAAGKIAPDPLLFQSGRRYSVEGGSDVPSDWARVP